MAKGSKSHRGNKTGAHSVKGVSDRNKRTFKRHKTDAKNKTKSIYKRKPKQQTPKNKTQETASAKIKKPAKADKSAITRKATPTTRKDRREERRRQRKNYSLVVQSLQLWEKLRRRDVRKAERAQILSNLMLLISAHAHELALKHDTARVVQCCLKLGSPEQRTSIFTELKDHILELSKLTYSKFIVKSMLRLCTAQQRGFIISAFYNHVRRLVRHSEASYVLEAAYNNHANAQQRWRLVQEFYGPQFALFKDSEAQSLEEVFLASNPSEKATICRHMKEALLPLLERSVLKHTIVHKALLDFFLIADESSKADMIEAVREVLVLILHTKEGSKVALHCLWHGTPKDRKVIVKSMKGLVKNICKEEHGVVAMLGLFDCVDDTVLVKKALLSELCGCLEELADDQHGRHVLLYLLSPRSPKHFSPQFSALLSPGDGNKHSKKAADVRYQELLEGVSGPLGKLASAKASVWSRSNSHAPLLVQAVKSIIGDDVSPVLSLLAEEVGEEEGEGEGEGEEHHLVSHPCGHWTLRQLLAYDNEQVDSGGKVYFAPLIMEKLNPSRLKAWVESNRGSFVVCSLLQSKVPGVCRRVTELLRPLVDHLRSGSLKGQEAILAELNGTRAAGRPR